MAGGDQPYSGLFRGSNNIPTVLPEAIIHFHAQQYWYVYIKMLEVESALLYLFEFGDNFKVTMI